MESPPRIDRARPSVFITALLALCSCCCWIDGHQEEEEHCSTLTRLEDQKRNYYFYYYIWTSSSFLGEGEHFSVCPIHFFFLFFIWHTRNNRERKRAMTIACTLSVKKKLEECGDLFVCKKKKESRGGIGGAALSLCHSRCSIFLLLCTHQLHHWILCVSTRHFPISIASFLSDRIDLARELRYKKTGW